MQAVSVAYASDEDFVHPARSLILAVGIVFQLGDIVTGIGFRVSAHRIVIQHTEYFGHFSLLQEAIQATADTLSRIRSEAIAFLCIREVERAGAATDGCGPA
jgi:hypothetical protein